MALLKGQQARLFAFSFLPVDGFVSAFHPGVVFFLFPGSEKTGVVRIVDIVNQYRKIVLGDRPVFDAGE